jgi:hypothetical protein
VEVWYETIQDSDLGGTKFCISSSVRVQRQRSRTNSIGRFGKYRIEPGKSRRDEHALAHPAIIYAFANFYNPANARQFVHANVYCHTDAHNIPLRIDSSGRIGIDSFPNNYSHFNAANPFPT